MLILVQDRDRDQEFSNFANFVYYGKCCQLCITSYLCITGKLDSASPVLCTSSDPILICSLNHHQTLTQYINLCY